MVHGTRRGAPTPCVLRYVFTSCLVLVEPHDDLQRGCTALTLHAVPHRNVACLDGQHMHLHAAFRHMILPHPAPSFAQCPIGLAKLAQHPVIKKTKPADLTLKLACMGGLACGCVCMHAPWAPRSTHSTCRTLHFISTAPQQYVPPRLPKPPCQSPQRWARRCRLALHVWIRLLPQQPLPL